MALITDPDQLNQDTEVVINEGNKTIQLVKTGNLSNDGVTIKALYSFLKEEWKSDADLIKYAFPMQPITDEQMELINGWDFDGSTTQYLIRTGGWALKDASGVSQEEWAGIVSLGTIGGTDQVYFQQSGSGSATNIQLQGVVNQAVKVYGDASHGNFDYRSYFKVFVREYAKTYGVSQLSDIGVSTMTYQVYRFPLANATDLKIVDTDNDVDTLTPYTGMTITWYAGAQQRTIGGANYNFHAIIDGNAGTAEEIYTFVQRQLRKNSDIDAGSGTKIGKVTSGLLLFTGDALKALLYTTGEGTFIDDFQESDTNRLSFMDDTNTERSFPYVAVLTLQFGDNLKNDTDATFKVFFTNDDAGSNLGYDFGTANALVCADAASNYMVGSSNLISLGSTQLTYDYDYNVQRGTGSDGDDAPITVVAIGLNTAQYIKATGNVARSTANVVSLVAPLERNFSNPS